MFHHNLTAIAMVSHSIVSHSKQYFLINGLATESDTQILRGWKVSLIYVTTKHLVTHVTELVIELCVHGCHVYDSLLVAAVGEELPCEYEARNAKEML